MTFAGFHAHGSIRTVWKALEFNRRKGGLGDEKAQTEKRESKRQSSHCPFLLFIDPRGLKQCHEATGEPPPLRKSKARRRRDFKLSQAVRGLSAILIFALLVLLAPERLRDFRR